MAGLAVLTAGGEGEGTGAAPEGTGGVVGTPMVTVRTVRAGAVVAVAAAVVVVVGTAAVGLVRTSLLVEEGRRTKTAGGGGCSRSGPGRRPAEVWWRVSRTR